MHIKGKLIATSFIAGAATALFASKQMNKNNITMSAPEKNSYETYPKTSGYNTMQTAAETNNFYTKAPSTAIDYNYDTNATSATSQTPYNVYFHNEKDPKLVGSTTPNALNNIDNGIISPNSTIKIDSI